MKDKAIVLLSGGLDSTVILAKALRSGRECLAISFDYGQRHKVELEAAREVAQFYGVSHKIIKLDNSIFGANSSLTSKGQEVPKDRDLEKIQKSSTPTTYVPARNTIFLSVALAHAENFEASEIHIGPNALDTKYPDCSEAFIAAFQAVIDVATKQSIEGKAPRLVAPLLKLNKAEIIKMGLDLGAPLELSFSCYDPDSAGKACGRCDACRLRSDGFGAQ